MLFQIFLLFFLVNFCQLFQGTSILLGVKTALYGSTVKYKGEIMSAEHNVGGTGSTLFSPSNRSLHVNVLTFGYLNCYKNKS